MKYETKLVRLNEPKLWLESPDAKVRISLEKIKSRARLDKSLLAFQSFLTALEVLKMTFLSEIKMSKK